jgi:hypothetical protein
MIFFLKRFSYLSAIWLTFFMTSVEAADFSCTGIHGAHSIIQIDEGVLTRKPSVKFSIIPSGVWKDAVILDFSTGWVTFSDGYGHYDEDSKKGYNRTCEKYENACGEYIKFFEYGRKVNGGYKITQFTSQDCCFKGQDLAKGSSKTYFDGELLCHKSDD